MHIVYGSHAEPEAVVRACIAQIDDLGTTDLAIAFCGGKHPRAEIHRALIEALGDCPIVGGAAAGAISRDGFGYSGFELILALFQPGDPTPHYAIVEGLDAGEQAAGRRLGASLANMAPSGAVVALFYDSVATSSPSGPTLHPAAPLVDGFYEGLGRTDVHLVGAGLLTDLNLTDGWVFAGDRVIEHGAVALAFPPNIAAITEIMHGCRPVSAFMEVTRIEGAVVYELDGRPALTVLEELFGLDSEAARSDANLTLLGTLGAKHGDIYAPFDEKAYVNRLIVSADRSMGSITIFEPDYKVGDQVQVMARDNLLMLDSVRDGAAAIEQRVAAEDVLLTLYLDCAGRASAVTGAPSEDAALAAASGQALGPLLGFYSGVEIAPVGLGDGAGRSRPLDWTAVMSTLYRRG